MDQAYNELLKKLPEHLHPFVVDQNYARYTSRDQAVWRYIMRRNLHYFSDHAHKAYIDGLKKTGISIDHIPNIVEMNRSLAKIGWGAVTVDGFLPPSVFMEFQYHKVLVISAEMRAMEHILYTPAPDIVHEAAGHAPIIANKVYASFLQRFGAIGMKAFASKQDHEIYQAIRHLSIIKEYPDTTPEEIARAEKDIEEKSAANTRPSEIALLSRLHWWTVEYGLIGTPDNYKIYGAGLLSSVGESKNCYSSKVKKIPLTIDAINYNYDITNEQPQLFVAKSGEHLLSVLEEFADTMAFRIGGKTALDRAIASATTATCLFGGGLQITGIVSEYLSDTGGEPVYLKMSGACSLNYKGKQLPGHGPEYHSEGFGSPIGKLKGSPLPLERYNDDWLKKAGMITGQMVTLEFQSGIKLNGRLQNIIRRDGCIILCTFNNCRVTSFNGDILFDPAWGTYDMAVGENILSAFAGPADMSRHTVTFEKSPLNAIAIKYTKDEQVLFDLYARVERELKTSSVNPDVVKDLYRRATDRFPEEWLLLLNLLELSRRESGLQEINSALMERLKILETRSDDLKELISSGIAALDPGK